MMPRVKLSLGNGFYKTRSLPFSAQRCVNMYPMGAARESLDQTILYNTPGEESVTLSGDTITGAHRGSRVVSGVLYCVYGTSLYSISSSQVVTEIGSIAGSEYCSMADNGTKLCIVVRGGNGYVYDNSTLTLAQITDTDYQASDYVIFIDGYFVFTASSGAQFFISALNDPSNIDPLDFGTAEIRPDNIVSCIGSHNELYILGEETIEVFQNVGGSGFPFQRIEGANVERGSHATFGTVIFDNTFVFIGGSKNEKTAVWRITGSTSAQKISTDAIDNEIQKFTPTEIRNNTRAFSYSEMGSIFVVYTFVSDANRIPSITFVYDASTNQWHERSSGVYEGRWEVDNIASYNNEIYTLRSSSTSIGRLDMDVYTELGNTIHREVVTQPFTSQNNKLFISKIELNIETGVGLTTGQGSNPQIMMQFSDDGGRTYNNEQWRSFGAKGAYNTRVEWYRQGVADISRVLRFRVSDPVKCSLIKLEADVNLGVPS